MNNHHLLLPDEYDALLQKKRELHDEMDEAGRLIADVTTQSSETYHDNAWFDEWVRIMNMLSMRNSELNQVLNNCQIISHDNIQSETIVIGSVVEIEHNGTKKNITIGWFFTIPWRVAYQSALGQALLWKRTGDQTQFSVWKVVNTVKIIQIIWI